jgi:hypothetical protein
MSVSPEPSHTSHHRRALGSDQPLYLPLLEAQIIRLLELTPGAPSSPINLRLFVAELEHHPTYEALSYVWGTSTTTIPITVNGRRMDITPNLHFALQKLRLTDRPRILWVDAICINQQNVTERSHHVSFMGKIYSHAYSVLIVLGDSPDGNEEDARALIAENAALVKQYESIDDMPILDQEDRTYDDPRWKSIATLMKMPWFTRAWVLQEVGLAVTPIAFYGPIEFPYRDLMRLAIWVTQCAPNLDPRAGVSFFAVHTDWGDWTTTGSHPGQTFLDLLSHAKYLSCREFLDHVYAFLGHPLARDMDGEMIVKPDYRRGVREVYLELAVKLLERDGLRVLSVVEHMSEDEEGPSWVPFVGDFEICSCSFGVYVGFYYNASLGASPCQPVVVDSEFVEVKGQVVDIVEKTYQFPIGVFGDEEVALMRRIWEDINERNVACAYGEGGKRDAFSLTLCGGLSTYNCAEDNLEQHRADFTAFWESISPASQASVPEKVESSGKEPSSTTRLVLLPEKLEEVAIKEDGENSSSQSSPPKLAEPASKALGEPTLKGDKEKYQLDVKLVCDGRTFFVTKKGYFGMGPMIAKEGDAVVLLYGGRSLYLLRKAVVPGGVAGLDQGQERYKLVGEAFVQGLMRGEGLKLGEEERKFVIC